MKTIMKIAKAELMIQQGYELGDFMLKFTSYESLCNHTSNFKNTVVANFDVYSLDGLTRESVHSYELFSYGFVTPSGYKSKKKVPVDIVDNGNLTLEEVNALKQFKAEFKINTFDPFYAENEANRRNASAWSYIAKNYISDPYCTK